MKKGMFEIFGPGGLIARHHPNYEYRSGQVQMAEAVASAIDDGGHLLVEAGTGTGKTLAYLIPALAASERVIISTGTKNLQEQLFFKDIPFLEKALGRKLRVAYMKGRSNYVCLNRLKKSEHAPILADLDETDYFGEVRRWAFESKTGDRAELTDLPETLSFWSSIDARSEICLGQKCPDYDECFITKMRERAVKADVVVVNHHLFFADLALRGNEYGAVIPDYSIVIFDEAHELEDIASEYFGAQVNTYRIADLLRDAQALPITDTTAANDILRAALRLQQRAERFWRHFLGDGRSSEGRFPLDFGFVAKKKAALAGRKAEVVEIKDEETEEESSEPQASVNLTPAGESLMALLNALSLVEATLAAIKDAPPEVENVLRRTAQIKGDLEFIMSCADPTYIYWYERRGRGVFLQATPIDLSEILADRLFDQVQTAILTSATLTSGGSFDFIKSRLGIKSTREVIVPSHFNFSRQAILYLPQAMPDPRDARFTDVAVEEIIRILQLTQGRAFVLCTAVSQMNQMYDRVSERVEFPCFVQGQGSKTGLLQKFRTTPHAVLFATTSFWQGVDVQGDALSCVIIDRLPFAVPTDPVIAARQRYLEQMGRNSFYEYSVPQAVIMLKQGLGRLIRSTSDVGVLSILDPRIRTKSYGSVFLRSLPPCPVTMKVEEVSQVFEQATSQKTGE